jgi:carboxymethylenebutenolidase
VAFYGYPVDRNRRAGAVPAPINQVDQLHGPILAFWGDQDAGVGMDNVERYVQAVQAREGVDFEYTVYPGLGHGFMSASRLDPNHAAFTLACEAWTRTLDFYRQHLGAPALATA